jgi:uncharacterized protein YjbI with pentapeptide repeats
MFVDRSRAFAAQTAVGLALVLFAAGAVACGGAAATDSVSEPEGTSPGEPAAGPTAEPTLGAVKADISGVTTEITDAQFNGDGTFTVGDCHLGPNSACPGADLRGLRFREGGQQWKQFEGVEFPGIDLSGTDLSGSDLHEANLEGANLSGANLTGVGLASAILKDADLTNANLTNANLTWASIRGANLDGAIFCHTVMPDSEENNQDCE